jgi:hypothetical protein
VQQGVYAQNNTVSSGGVASGSGGSSTYSIGQLDYMPASGSGGSATFRVAASLGNFGDFRRKRNRDSTYCKCFS